MAGNFDDIIRRLLGMHQPMPDESQPFGGSPLAPMIDQYLDQTERDVPTAEGQMPPMSDPDFFRHMMTGGSQRLLYEPGRGTLNSSAPMIIPNAEPTIDDTPNAPLRRGNAKYGTGLDV